MHLSDNISLDARERFAVGSSTLAAYTDRPERIDGGLMLFCRNGTARLSVDVHSIALSKGSVMVTLPGKILTLESSDSEFYVDYIIFSRDMFEEASYRMDMSFFKFLAENPHCHHTEESIESFGLWWKSVVRIHDNRCHLYRETIMKNLLQNLFLTIYDAIRRCDLADSDEHSNRQTQLFHRYVALVRDNFREQHNVSYYASQMCITTRYLSTIVRNISGDSPKNIIDRMVVLEIKLLLRSTNMSVQEIAVQMHFPDQSYMGRYFRKHTAMSPSEYRNRI